MIISLNEEAPDKIQYSIKVSKLGREGNSLNLHAKPTANNVLTGERLNAFPIELEHDKVSLLTHTNSTFTGDPR